MASTAGHSARAAGDDFVSRFHAVRGTTLEFVRTLEVEDFVVQTMPDVSPAKWHLAHTTWFFENFLLRERLPGYRVFHERYGYLFNSYYYRVGAMHRRPERGLLTRPTVREILAYREHVDAHMQQLIEHTGDDAEIAALVTLGMHHEQQHQELLLTDIKHVFSCNPLQPMFRELAQPGPGTAPELRFIAGHDGIHVIGHGGDGFAFDNESPRHDVLLHPHAIANRPVSNAEFRAFIADGGYDRPELWLSDGWTTVQERGWNRPLYWTEDLATEFTLGGLREINPHAPVSHVSFYEADAYARWAGCRLPTEDEWEVWAADCAVQGNFVDRGLLHPAPAAEANGKLQVFGDAWEWTMSSYSPYPGFRASSNAIGEYNGKFMSNQYVLRGGSCATHSTHMRRSYRNFFYPDARWQFSGIRLAKDPT